MPLNMNGIPIIQHKKGTINDVRQENFFPFSIDYLMLTSLVLLIFVAHHTNESTSSYNQDSD
jgi:hypothetical protein